MDAHQDGGVKPQTPGPKGSALSGVQGQSPWPSVLAAEGLVVSYALHGVDLAVAAGELVVLLGASGCGKTTLLRALAGFVAPDAGRVVIDGRDMAGVPPHRRPVNMMFQSYALFPHMSVAANVAFGLRREGLRGAAVRARTKEALAVVRMAGFEGRRPDQLSGGQRQRVALARAIAKQPLVLLLDEPLSALDRTLREETAAELVRLQRALEIAFVTVTHDQAEAMSMADRIAVMDRGGIVQVGPPAEVYGRPVNRFVASFVGGTNLFEGVVEGGVLRCAGAGASFFVGDRVAAGPAALGVRPERVVMRAAGEGRLEGVVENVAFLGARWLVQARLAGGMVVRVEVAARPEAERVGLDWAETDVMVFAGAA